MQILRESIGLEEALETCRAAGQRIALVPTMGALHDGHMALVEHARAVADKVIASIFVNPAQFNDPADLARYPRSEEADAAMLEAAGCDLLWVPDVAAIYPPGFATRVSVSGVGERWEGAHRPGHFDGVATVVARLFGLVRPDVALFGEKDWQQLALIRRMATDLGMGFPIIGVATVREADGLAMSSRNRLLGPDQRAAAAALPRVLADLAERLASGELPAPAIATARAALEKAGFGPIDYVALVDGDTLDPIDSVTANARLIAAAHLGQVRLIDNMRVIADTTSQTWSPPR